MERFRYLDHTGDLGVEVFGDTLEALFEHAGEAFMNVITDPETVKAAAAIEIAVGAPDLEQLLVEWLTELIYQFEVHGRLFRRYEVRFQDDGRLLATARGETYNPDLHPIRTTVKGATYHQLEVRRTGNGWRARVIFDL